MVGLEVDIVLYALDRETRVDRPAVGFLRPEEAPMKTLLSGIVLCIGGKPYDIMRLVELYELGALT